MGLLILCIHSVCPLISLSLSIFPSRSSALSVLYSQIHCYRILVREIEKIGDWDGKKVVVFSVTKINGGKKRTWKRKSAGKKETAGKKWHLQDSWQVYSYRLEEKFWKIWQGSSWHLSQATHLRIHLCLCLCLSVCLFVCVKVSVALLTQLSVFCVALY